MRHLKVFENQSNNRFEKFINDKAFFLQDISDYFNVLNPKINNNHIDAIDLEYWRGNRGEIDLEIFYFDREGDRESIVLKNEKAQDLIDFINNTELYRSAKKYNL